jgi:hypothetical protein
MSWLGGGCVAANDFISCEVEGRLGKLWLLLLLLLLQLRMIVGLLPSIPSRSGPSPWSCP